MKSRNDCELYKINDFNDITIRTMEEKEKGIIEALVRF